MLRTLLIVNKSLEKYMEEIRTAISMDHVQKQALVLTASRLTKLLEKFGMYR